MVRCFTFREEHIKWSEHRFLEILKIVGFGFHLVGVVYFGNVLNSLAKNKKDQRRGAFLYHFGVILKYLDTSRGGSTSSCAVNMADGLPRAPSGSRGNFISRVSRLFVSFDHSGKKSPDDHVFVCDACLAEPSLGKM